MSVFSEGVSDWFAAIGRDTVMSLTNEQETKSVAVLIHSVQLPWNTRAASVAWLQILQIKNI